MVRVDHDPIPQIFDWPVQYKLNSSYDKLSLKIYFEEKNVVKLKDSRGEDYEVQSLKGYTIIGTSRYGGDHTECFIFQAVNSLRKIDLFMIIPSHGAEFNNQNHKKIIPPGPTQQKDIIITPLPLTIFKHLSFESLSKRIYSTLKR